MLTVSISRTYMPVCNMTHHTYANVMLHTRCRQTQRLRCRLFKHHHVHGGEDALLAALHQGVDCVEQHVMHLVEALGREAQQAQRVDDGTIDVAEQKAVEAQAVVPVKGWC